MGSIRRPTEQTLGHSSRATRPRWSAVLRALREARGVTLDGWSAQLGVSRTTVQRWERGERAPDPGAEAAILRYCRERDLFRTFERGPLAGLDLSSERLEDLLAEARWRPGGSADASAAGSAAPGGVQTPYDAQHSNLPAVLTSFVGRERELAEVRRLQGKTRLLTLTGTGGCGKTRLALAIANELPWAYPHGVWLVELAALGSPELVPQTVAAALSVTPAERSSPTEALIAMLKARQLLLVLDNCEHLLNGIAPLLETLLRASPGLEILATSREPLGIGGEVIWPVPPMSVTSRGEAGAEPSDAVCLFVERARLHRPDFELTSREAPLVAQVCERLDGIPLAIELAAARLKVLPVEQIAARLDDRFRVLTGGSRTAPSRHQTLRAAMDWSYALLTAPEQGLLRRLAIFAGDFSLEAAESVTADADTVDGEVALAAVDVLDLLARLVDKSLVSADSRGDAVRYRMLETVRQYAAERLSAAGELDVVRARHARWCLGLAEAAEAHWEEQEQGVWLEQLAVEHDNLRAALAWCLSNTGDVALGVRLGGALWWFWKARNHFSEGRRWLTALLERGAGAPADARAKALTAAGLLARSQGDYLEATHLHEQSLALRRGLGDELNLADSLTNLGVAVGRDGDPARAQSLYEQSLPIFRKLGMRARVAKVLHNLGFVAYQQGDLRRAVALYEEALGLDQGDGDPQRKAATVTNLGDVHLDEGLLEQAAARYCQGLALYSGVQNRLGIARCLEGLTRIAGIHGDAERAARLGGAAAALREAIDVFLPPSAHAVLNQTMVNARAALGEAGVAVAWAEGEALSLEQATALALQERTAVS